METLNQSEIIFFILVMAITAVPAGFAAGLFGIGGGLITVPILFYIFGSFGIDQSYLMHLAVGTSFSIIIPTSIVSVLTHKKHGSVDFNVIKNYGSFVISGVILGTIFAAYMKTKTLLIFFSTVVFILGTYLLLLQNNVKEIKKKFGLFSKIICGFVSGFISAPMGIGGAVMNVPILRYFGYPINKAIGSAAAIGFIIALFGAVGFLLSGTFMNTNLPYSVGFINIPTFLIFVPITTFMARIGANAAHRINKTKLQRLFGIFLYIVGTVFLYRHLSF